MLIIFDLDDTLIQTSQFITPWRFEKVLDSLNLENMIKDQILQDLIACHLKFESSQEALDQVLRLYKLDESLIKQAKLTFNSYDPSIPVHLFKGVDLLLENLKSAYKLVLVTRGHVDQQRLKIEKAGFSEAIFDQIIIVEHKDKKEAFSTVSSGYNSNKVFVIGDRVDVDLQPAKALGFKTCLVRQGRGEYQKISPIFVDYIIQDVIELENLLKSIT